MRRQEINRVVVVVNPVSTRHDVIQPRIDNLRESFGNQLRLVESSPCSIDTTNMLKDQLEPHDIVATAGGDGTARTAVEALADTDVPANRSILLPLPGGHRNDLVRQLHGMHRKHSPSQLIRDLSVADVLPLQTTFERDGIRSQRLSALYTGVGAIAAGAHYVSSPEFRSRPGYHNAFVRELHGLSVLPWTLRHAHSIAVRDDDSVERTLFDATLVNARVIAQHLHPPVDLLDDGAFYAEIKSQSLRDVVPYVLRLMAQPHVKPPAHRMLKPGEEVGFTLHEPAYVHTDGDAELLDEGQHVSFGLHTVAFRALCSQPPQARMNPGWLSDHSIDR